MQASDIISKAVSTAIKIKPRSEGAARTPCAPGAVLGGLQDLQVQPVLELLVAPVQPLPEVVQLLLSTKGMPPPL